MVFGVPPFYDKNSDKLFRKIIFNEVDVNKYKNQVNLSDEAKDLISSLLNKNAKERISISSVKEHAFFSGISFEDIYNRKMEPPFYPSVFEQLIFLGGQSFEVFPIYVQLFK